MPTSEQITPYLLAFNSLLSVGTLGYLLNITKRIDDLNRAKSELQEERIRIAQDQLANSSSAKDERLHIVQDQLAYVSNVRADLAKDVEKLNERLASALREAGVTSESVASMSSYSKIEAALKQNIEDLASQFQTALAQLYKDDATKAIEDPQWYLEVATALAATKQWHDAAKQYTYYLGYVKDDWSAYLYCGVAFANSREGNETDVLAVRAFSESIALLPRGFSDNTRKARLFTYRGAMFKRLNRLEESISDLHLASMLATSEREVLDLKYNLACVYAMQGEKEKMMSEIEAINTFPNRERALSAIRAHLKTYFQNFTEDGDLLRSLGYKN